VAPGNGLRRHVFHPSRSPSVAGLADRPRTGRPRRSPRQWSRRVKTMACEPPEHHQVPQARWSPTDLAAEDVAEAHFN
jgi:hypothetical protein